MRLIGQFRQLTTSQIRALAFADMASKTPLDRTLKRLTERKYLVRLQRLVGGSYGGSGQYVYQLGRQGWKLLNKPGDYWAPRAVNLHTLAIADCLVALKRVEGSGLLEVVEFVTEPECHKTVGDQLLTPDAYVELNHRGNKLLSWLEIDRGTEHADKIQEKCVRYWKASVSGQWDGYFPYVLFVVPDVHRQRAIERVIQSGPADAQALFNVCPIAEFPRLSTT
ncbi:hypothetical protein JOF56_003017 [Kibdelosporangium banguiense]|uniref:Replication-relaxation n=1 Tax=Kibdelosporangium banguiense TaxID=1365924 RepID=A0ABS4TDZ5_9PSEU|nr:replication-relaxation family protein [Kibdelosporangium banguiense]MBP2322632.1 hypothetical protein [Kibdelosporangium banguiense]